jgi:hypothetical protein
VRVWSKSGDVLSQVRVAQTWGDGMELGEGYYGVEMVGVRCRGDGFEY